MPTRAVQMKRHVVGLLFCGERQPETVDLDAAGHREAKPRGERRAVADGMGEVPADRLVESGHQLAGEARGGSHVAHHQ